MNKMDSSNTWVFVSHSNKDFEKIVKVRNKLEAIQYRPLLFFLKCLEDDQEVFELIKREIKARDRFILCQSRNAQESVWVQREMDYIISLNRPYEIINIDDTEKEIDECIKRFDKRSTIYIWSTDYFMGRLVGERLVGKAFKVVFLQDDYFKDYYLYKTGSPDLVSDDFHDVIGDGYVLLLVSRKLSDNEESEIELVSGYFRRHARNCCCYIISKEGMENGMLFYELQNGDGIHSRIIFNGVIQERNDAQCADNIVDDILTLDKYLNAYEPCR